ncbi:MAG: imidazoleglycerol-phosphate dehydratase, partial [Halobacteriales archaeon]|nr:imidazoleglycerol-phosphate dehydratase [Halobacteriales archaeon]
MSRVGEVERRTKETQVAVRLDLDGGGTYDVQTPNVFLTHMLEAWSRHAGFGLRVRAAADLDHHLIEDVGIALGQAFRAAFAAAPCQRIAYDIVPMDDALVLAAVDLVDRPYYEGGLPLPIWEHFLRSFALEARINLHVDLLRGRDTHHAVEAALKAFARALRRALEPREEEVSTKGRVQTRVRAAAHLKAPEDAGDAAQALRTADPLPSDRASPLPVDAAASATAAATARSLEEAELEALSSDPAKLGWSWREGSTEPKVRKALKDIEVRHVGKDGRPRLEAKGKRRKAAEGPSTIVAPPRLGKEPDRAALPAEDTDQDPGFSHAKPESLAAASGEVNRQLSKTELPEVKAARERHRETHVDHPKPGKERADKRQGGAAASGEDKRE